MPAIYLLPLFYLASAMQAWLALEWRGPAPDLLALVAFTWFALEPQHGERRGMELLVLAAAGFVADANSQGPLGIGVAAYAVVGYGLMWLNRRLILHRAAGQVATVGVAAFAATLLGGIALRCAGQTSLAWHILTARSALVGLFTALARSADFDAAFVAHSADFNGRIPLSKKQTDPTQLAGMHSRSSINRRLRWLFATIVVCTAAVYGRLIALEVRDGAEYRTAAAEPILHRRTVPAVRGPILARDGTVLAYDEPMTALALNYRWLEEPANPQWLRRTARARLSAAQRRDPTQVSLAQQQVLDERRALWQRLRSLCGLSDPQWQQRTGRIQRRVEELAGTVNSRRRSTDSKNSNVRAEDSETDGASGLPALVGRSIAEALFAGDEPPPTTAISEQLAEHVVCEELPLEVVAEIETHPTRYPGVKLLPAYRRVYSHGDLAAHAVGYLGRANDDDLGASNNSNQHLDGNAEPAYIADDWLGRAGIERKYESLLRARRGVVLETLDARGTIFSTTTVQQPQAGNGLMLTIDPALQQTAERLLDQAIARRLPSGDAKLDAAAGGAVIVLDVHDGSLLAAAAGPRFNPNDFVRQNNESIQQLLVDPARPLFDRTIQMALPPGSVFKLVSAAALLSEGVDPNTPVECQGYLHWPEALRCAIFRRYGVGHGPVALDEALARSCNVYFFHQAEQLGAAPLVDWARRFQFGLTTGVDLPAEARGNVPAIPIDRQKTSAIAPVSFIAGASNPAAFDPRLIAIGQGPLTCTPLQIARMTAAIANGGYLVTPHLAQRVIASNDADVVAHQSEKTASKLFEVSIPHDDDPLHRQPPHRIPGLSTEMLATIRTGMRRAVADDDGTAHATVELAQVAIAGKTGTAETGAGKPEHAWFAGYVSAGDPQFAVVVVIEHAGNAATSAGPVVQHLVQRMDEMGYFSLAEHAHN